MQHGIPSSGWQEIEDRSSHPAQKKCNKEFTKGRAHASSNAEKSIRFSSAEILEEHNHCLARADMSGSRELPSPHVINSSENDVFSSYQSNIASWRLQLAAPAFHINWTQLIAWCLPHRSLYLIKSPCTLSGNAKRHEVSLIEYAFVNVYSCSRCTNHAYMCVCGSQHWFIKLWQHRCFSQNRFLERVKLTSNRPAPFTIFTIIFAKASQSSERALANFLAASFIPVMILGLSTFCATELAQRAILYTLIRSQHSSCPRAANIFVTHHDV